MKIEQYRKYLKKQNFSPKDIENAVSFLNYFNDFIKTKNAALNVDSVSLDIYEMFIEDVIKNKQDTHANIYAISRYYFMKKNSEMLDVVMMTVEGFGVIETLRSNLGKIAGEKKRDEIFGKLQLLSPAISNKEKPRFTKELIESFKAKLSPVTCKSALMSNLHNIPSEWFVSHKKKFHELKNIDRFLEYLHAEHVKMLDNCRKQGIAWYAQFISDEVFKYLKAHPTYYMAPGKDAIIHERPPYNTQKFLKTTDPVMKRYYFCHCPWVREAIKEGNNEIDTLICNCSAGFGKLIWDVVFEQPVEAFTIESVLAGNQTCRFVIKIPENILEKYA
jgi:hypothetical protein